MLGQFLLQDFSQKTKQAVISSLLLWVPRRHLRIGLAGQNFMFLQRLKRQI
jgi:hypothetical protein